MPISSRKKIISFFYRKINSAGKKTPGKKATTKTKNLTKKKKRIIRKTLAVNIPTNLLANSEKLYVLFTEK